MKWWIDFSDYKASYILYNFLNQKKLKHNKHPYKQYGLRKPLFWSIQSSDFQNEKTETPWLDTEEGVNKASNMLQEASIMPLEQIHIKQWYQDGYLIFKQFISPEYCDKINAEIDALLKQKVIQFKYGNKLMFVIKKSPLIKNVCYDKTLLKILSFILGKEVIPFQTINFLKGSEQKAHSDSIHMTTHPQGYLIAVWIALEDITSENGPLFYYPKSHRLPYIMNKDFNHGGGYFTLGHFAYNRYEKIVEETIKEKNLTKKEFIAQKGDVLIWHANLLHGGTPIVNPNLTRKSMVIHYFASDVIKYHEISQRPALLDI